MLFFESETGMHSLVMSSQRESSNRSFRQTFVRSSHKPSPLQSLVYNEHLRLYTFSPPPVQSPIRGSLRPSVRFLKPSRTPMLKGSFLSHRSPDDSLSPVRESSNRAANRTFSIRQRAAGVRLRLPPLVQVGFADNSDIAVL